VFVFSLRSSKECPSFTSWGSVEPVFFRTHCPIKFHKEQICFLYRALTSAQQVSKLFHIGHVVCCIPASSQFCVSAYFFLMLTEGLLPDRYRAMVD